MSNLYYSADELPLATKREPTTEERVDRLEHLLTDLNGNMARMCSLLEELVKPVRQEQRLKEEREEANRQEQIQREAREKIQREAREKKERENEQVRRERRKKEILEGRIGAEERGKRREEAIDGLRRSYSLSRNNGCNNTQHCLNIMFLDPIRKLEEEKEFEKRKRYNEDRELQTLESEISNISNFCNF
jgi:hypothetical protein